jgi:hypothetical protein
MQPPRRRGRRDSRREEKVLNHEVTKTTKRFSLGPAPDGKSLDPNLVCDFGIQTNITSSSGAGQASLRALRGFVV